MDAIRDGKLAGKLPGVLVLASEYDVSPATMRSAIRLLETQGWIRNEGLGRPRMAQIPEKSQADETKVLNVTIFPGICFADEDGVFQKLVMQAQLKIDLVGHNCKIASKSQQDFNHDPERIARYVKDHPADAWVLIGPQHRVVSWFLEQRIPCICMGGMLQGLKVAATGMDALPTFEKVLQYMIQLGHRRIVFLWPEYRMRGELDAFVAVLRKVLSAAGIEVGTYHLPVWKSTPEGLMDVLEQEFRYTRPTAIITTYGKWMAGVLSFLARKGLKFPEDVSLFSMSDDDWFPWVEPKISCLRGDDILLLKRVVRWLEALSRGKSDRDCIMYPLEWDMGNSIGPAR
jgi:DNA-binding LacI/PurR family transcriptional regulator